MKKSLLSLLVLLCCFQFTSNAQVLPQSSLLKMGVSPEWMLLQESGNFAFQLGLENSTKVHFITNEISTGWMHKHNDLYYVKFDYKFYPISALLKNFRYQGIYVGFGPGLYLQDLPFQANDFGIALFASCGFQFFVNNRLSVAWDLEFSSVRQRFSYDQIPPHGDYHKPGPSSWQAPPAPLEFANDFYMNNSIKIGYLFNRPKSRKTVKTYD